MSRSEGKTVLTASLFNSNKKPYTFTLKFDIYDESRIVQTQLYVTGASG